MAVAATRGQSGGAAMTVLLDTSSLPARDRADAIRDTVAQTFVHVELTFATDSGPAAAVGAITDFGQLTIFSVRTNHSSAERTPQLARDDLRPSIIFGLQLTGESLVAQGDRQAVVRPGELVIYDSTRPYVLTFPDGIRQHFFRIPVDRLALPHDAIRRVSALTLSPGHPVTDVAATYFRRLASRPDLFTVPGGADVLSEPSIELMRAVITTHLDAAELGKEPLKATLPLRILEYARTHLRDPHLGAAQVAAAHHISERHLYNVLGASGITLADWIRKQRLQRCRDDIAASAFHATPIASIARGWGFTDASSFTRMFKNAYSMSPREWRHQANTRRSEPTGEFINQ
jgi:AraC-like DNA-binding protein